MGDVTEIHKDTLEYITDTNDKFIGVRDSSSNIQFVSRKNKVFVYVDQIGIIDKVKFKELCIAWLALNYPASLKFDE